METGHGIKYRQLHIEDYLREIPAEQGRETVVYAHERITGNPDTNTDFDTVNHSKLIEVLSRTVKDGRVISLIHKYLKAGVMEDGGFHAAAEGVPQGGLCKAQHRPPYAKQNTMQRMYCFSL
ncbi:hypothetical protein [Enterocloster clostridioformis]|uniref:hypothetical protein n=1 Tax=Enterocloster clostridioformis TaxID=1531 RepID=UPI0002D1D781|nr:hypothetical protein [Enterocloster clostridioformis]ENZ00326.1 hypothetical protein HMPREF1086_04920 [[Clostridium] clostridioforme 90B1]